MGVRRKEEAPLGPRRLNPTGMRGFELAGTAMKGPGRRVRRLRESAILGLARREAGCRYADKRPVSSSAIALMTGTRRSTSLVLEEGD